MMRTTGSILIKTYSLAHGKRPGTFPQRGLLRNHGKENYGNGENTGGMSMRGSAVCGATSGDTGT